MTKEKAYRYRLSIDNLRKSIIDDIKQELRNLKAQEVSFSNGIIYNYIDDQMNEVIAGVTLNELVFIDDSFDMDTISLQDLSTDQLIGVLDNIESGDYTIVEDIEE